jgi:hypothetical protein
MVGATGLGACAPAGGAQVVAMPAGGCDGAEAKRADGADGRTGGAAFFVLVRRRRVKRYRIATITASGDRINIE